MLLCFACCGIPFLVPSSAIAVNQQHGVSAGRDLDHGRLPVGARGQVAQRRSPVLVQNLRSLQLIRDLVNDGADLLSFDAVWRPGSVQWIVIIVRQLR